MLFFQMINPAMPILLVLLTAVAALLMDLFSPSREKTALFMTAILGLLASMCASLMLIGHERVLLWHGFMVSDDRAHLMMAFITGTIAASLLYLHQYMVKRDMPFGDYTVLALFSTLGMVVLVSCQSLLTMYLGLELLSLPLYAMTAICRERAEGAEAAMKYFVMGSMASGILLYGISLLYGATGTLNLIEIANTIASNRFQNGTLFSFAEVFIIVGVGFKLAAVPFHMWLPDVYEGAPTPVTLFLSAGPKVAAMGMTLRLLTEALPGLLPAWQPLLIVMALLSMGVGNLVAMSQTNLKRLFAYSAIAHIGYALLGFLPGTPAGDAAALYYLLVYAVMTIAAFGFLLLLPAQGIEIETVSDLKGLNSRHPWAAFLMLIVMFSMAGVPPTVGFFIKLTVLKAAIDAGLTWLATLGVLFAVLGAYYYIRIVKTMYFDAPETVQVNHVGLSPSAFSTWCFSANCLLLLYWGIFPSGLLMQCIRAMG